MDDKILRLVTTIPIGSLLYLSDFPWINQLRSMDVLFPIGWVIEGFETNPELQQVTDDRWI